MSAARAGARGIAAPIARRTARRALSTGAEGFTRLEHAMWESGTAPYADMFAPLTGQAAAPLVDAARVVAGQRVLDVATGPGQTARYAAERGAEEVIALDFSEEMLAVAERLTRPSSAYRAIRFVHGDATALPLADASVDAVTCAFGVLHLAEPLRFFTEARRVLTPQGSIAFSVWDVPSADTGMRIVTDAIAEHGAPVELPGGDDIPSFFHFADADAATTALAAGGFDASAVKVQRMTLHAQLADSDALFRMFAEGTARTRATLDGQTAERRAAIRAAMRATVEAKFGAEGPTVPFAAVVVSACSRAGGEAAKLGRRL